MEIINAQVLVDPNKFSLIDKRLVTLESISAEIGARLTRISMKRVCQCESFDDGINFNRRTLIPVKTI